MAAHPITYLKAVQNDTRKLYVRDYTPYVIQKLLLQLREQMRQPPKTELETLGSLEIPRDPKAHVQR